MKVNHAVQDAAAFMKCRQDHLEKLSIARFVTPVDGVGHEIGQLKQARNLRIGEQGNFGEAFYTPETRSRGSELGHQGLNGLSRA